MSVSLGMMLLGMQAGGTLLDFFGNQQQREMGRLGERVNQSQIELNIEAASTAAAQESLEEMRALQTNLSSQFAIQAARGTSSSAGSAMFIRQKSERVAADDERMRQLNLKSKIATLHATGFISSLHQMETEAKASSALTSRIFNTLPTQAGVESFRRASFARSAGFGLEKASV